MPLFHPHNAFSRLLSAGLFCAGFAFVSAAPAQELNATGTGLPLWEAGAFAGALSSPAYPASSQQNQRALVLPFLVYRGEVLRADRSGVGARMVHTDRVEFDVGFSGSLPASSNDIELRRGMPDLGTLIEFGPRLKLLLATPAPSQRFTLEVPLRAVLEFNGGVRQQGYALEPKLAFEQSIGSEWRVKTAFSAVVGDAQLNQYFYSVPAAYVTANRPAFDAQSGLISTRLSIDGSRRLGPDLRVFAFARQDFYDGATNRGSPLFAQNQGTSLGLGLTWTLGRSESRVSE
jgi:outer membrane scaffolding protein for murein synthesis (MipA/OmpV family)